MRHIYPVQLERDDEALLPPNPAIEGHFAKLNSSLHNFYNRSRIHQNLFTFKDDHCLLSLTADLEEIIGSLEAKLVQAQTAIEEQYHNLSLKMVSGERQIIQALDTIEVSASPKNIHQILEEFLKKTLSNNYNLPALAIEPKLYAYLLYVTSLQQLVRALAIANTIRNTEGEEKKILIQQLGNQLTHKRPYALGGFEKMLKGYLFFEYETQKGLWWKQVAQVERMLLSPTPRLVLELIMGSGKTYFGIPFADYHEADGNHFVCNIWTEPMGKTNIPQLANQTYSSFKQLSNTFKMARNKKMSAEDWKLFLLTLKRCLHHRETMNMVKEDCQALELKFLDLLEMANNGYKGSPDLMEQIENLGQILLLLRTHGKGNIDEPHEIFNRKKELNYPLGSKKAIEKRFVTIIEGCIAPMCANPTLAKFMDPVWNQETDDVEKESAFNQKIRPYLALRWSRSRDFNIPDDQRSEFIEYITKKSKSAPPFIKNHPKWEEIALLRGVLTSLLPKALAQIEGVAFGRSKRQSTEVAKPYLASGTPERKFRYSQSL